MAENKNKSAHISWLWILVNFPIDGQATWSKKHMFLQKDVESSINGECKKRKFKEEIQWKGNFSLESKTTEISLISNEEIGLGEFETHNKS